MRGIRNWIRIGVTAAGWALSLGALPSAAQIGPAEILDPRLKALEQAHIRDLVDLNQAIGALSFPFLFKVSRYAGLDPPQQIGTDARGLEFVNFHGRSILKVTGNYNAAFSADLLTQNERAARVFDEVIIPILRLVTTRSADWKDFDAFGFEIAYHARKQNRQFSFEGKEILVVVMDRTDAVACARAGDETERQRIVNRSCIYVDGKPLGMALGARDPFEVAGLPRSLPGTSSNPVAAVAAQPSEPAPVLADALLDSRKNLTDLEQKYRTALDGLAKEGSAKYHFVDYAPPCFVSVRNRTALQLTLRDPDSFDANATSIYRRAAQGFDLFFAPQLKSMLALIPESTEFDDLDITILDELVRGSGKSSEALEFIIPVDLLRRFTAAEVTNQELINRSVVLVNGVRIALNLQQVE